ncbi:hypothetical protein [Wenzhouxiangella sp. EGI_FJ10305]|uniref:hypothetical protein n=1 Tax=Wenzhouxiangella sp. EGI_FJ10305 TaxID=3243768 RepID=UPI0035E189E2
MSEATKSFLTKLAEDPELRESFKADPKKVMDEHDVPADHQEMILKGDKQGVMEAAGAQDIDSDLLIF